MINPLIQAMVQAGRGAAKRAGPAAQRLGQVAESPELSLFTQMIAAGQERPVGAPGGMEMLAPALANYGAQKGAQREKAAEDQRIQNFMDVILPTLDQNQQNAVHALGPEIGIPAIAQYMLESNAGGGGDGFTLGQGQVRYDASGNEVARNGSQQSAAQRGHVIDGRLVSPTGDVLYEPDQEAAPPDFSTENQLRNQARADEAIKGFTVAQRNIGAMRNMVNDNSGASDVALVFAFFKTIDPASTVREGEYAAAAGAAGLPAWIVGAFERMTTGQKLTPELRRDLVAVAEQYAEQHGQAYDQRAAFYSDLASRYGMDPAAIVPPRFEAAGGPTSAGASGAPTAPAVAPPPGFVVDQ